MGGMQTSDNTTTSCLRPASLFETDTVPSRRQLINRDEWPKRSQHMAMPLPDALEIR